MSRIEAPQARRSGASTLEIFTQSVLHCAQPKTHCPEMRSKTALSVVAHVFSWPKARFRHDQNNVSDQLSLTAWPANSHVHFFLFAALLLVGA